MKEVKRAKVSFLCIWLLFSGLISAHADQVQPGQSTPKTITMLRYQVQAASGEQDIVILFHANFSVMDGQVRYDSRIDYSNTSDSGNLGSISPHLEQKSGQTDITLTCKYGSNEPILNEKAVLLTLTPSIVPADGTVVTSPTLYVDLVTVKNYFSALSENTRLNKDKADLQKIIDTIQGTKREDVKINATITSFADAIVVQARTETVSGNHKPILIQAVANLYPNDTATADTPNSSDSQVVYLSDQDRKITFSGLQSSTERNTPYTVVIKELNTPASAAPAISPPLRSMIVNGAAASIKTLPTPAPVILGSSLGSPIVATYVNNKQVDTSVTLAQVPGPGSTIRVVLYRTTSTEPVEASGASQAISVSEAKSYTLTIPTTNLPSGTYFAKVFAPPSTSYSQDSRKQDTPLGVSNPITVNPDALVTAFEMQFLMQGNQPKLTFIADTKVPASLELMLKDVATGQTVGISSPNLSSPVSGVPVGVNKTSVDVTPISPVFANVGTKGVTFTLIATATDGSQLKQQQTFTMTIGATSNPAVTKFVTSLNTAVAHPNDGGAKRQGINVGNILTTGIVAVLKLFGITL